MSFLGQPAYDAMLDALRVALVTGKVPISETPVDVTGLADSTAHYKYFCMAADDFNRIDAQIECTDGSGAGDVVTFSWDSTNEPVTSPVIRGFRINPATMYPVTRGRPSLRTASPRT